MRRERQMHTREACTRLAYASCTCEFFKPHRPNPWAPGHTCPPVWCKHISAILYKTSWWLEANPEKVLELNNLTKNQFYKKQNRKRGRVEVDLTLSD